MSRVPSPKGLPFFGTLFSLIKEGGGPNLHKYVDKRHKELGPLYKEKIGPVEAYFLNNPSDMRKVFALEGQCPVHILPECWVKYNQLYGCKRGLYFMDGEEWMKYRRILNKYLLKNYDAEFQSKLSKPLFEAFENDVIRPNHSESINFEPHLYQLSIFFVISTMLGSPFINHYKTLSDEIVKLSQFVHKIFEYSVSLSLIPIELSIKLNLSAWKNFIICVEESLSIASILCDKIDKINGDGLMDKLKQENVSSDVIRRIVIDFIIAAGDTTAISTQWILYLLARHSAVQNQLHADLISSKSTNHNEPINNIIRETLRLYPIAPFLTRYLPNDIELRGYNIPNKSLIIMSTYSSSRDSNYFLNPNEFQPNRWTRENNKYKNVADPFASIPFAMGARSCIGRKLAQTQMYLTISQIVKNYHIEVEKEVNMVLKLITVPEEPIKFYLSRRKNISMN